MLKNKRKILFVSEVSFAKTGFGVIYNELISRFHKSNKFRVAEFATNTSPYYAQDEPIKWRLYPNCVTPDDPRYQIYKSHKSNEHGEWRFSKVLLDFEPDIVVDLRDPPMFEFEYLNPLRPYFHWCIAPTVDSAPQPSSWIEMFVNADTVLPYSNFGYETLKAAHPKINALDGYGPGINLEVFHPQNKQKIRKKYKIDEDAKIVGFVSRNQGRKQFADLLLVFKELLKARPSEKLFLHLHTAFPDLRYWNLPALLVEENLAENVLFTYYCHNCGHTMIDVWHGSVTVCENCSNRTALHPRTGLGCTQDVMCDIYNLYDIYIQYSNCEGLGVGTLEAAACGVPCMAIDYSAMASLNALLNSGKINYILKRDVNADAYRAVPDSQQAFQLLMRYLDKSKGQLQGMGAQTRELCEQHFSWDNIAQKWIDLLDNVKLTGLQGKWGRPKTQQFETKTSNSIYSNIQHGLRQAGRSDLKNSYYVQTLYTQLMLNNAGYPHHTINKDDLNKVVNNLAKEASYADAIHTGKMIMDSEDFIDYADLKEVSNL